jgi:hypothetical protein
MQAYIGHARMQELAAQQELRSACIRVLRAATLLLTSLHRHPGQTSEVPRHKLCHVHLCGATLRAWPEPGDPPPRAHLQNALPSRESLESQACPGPPGAPSPTPPGLKLAPCEVTRASFFLQFLGRQPGIEPGRPPRVGVDGSTNPAFRVFLCVMDGDHAIAAPAPTREPHAPAMLMHERWSTVESGRCGCLG